MYSDDPKADHTYMSCNCALYAQVQQKFKRMCQRKLRFNGKNRHEFHVNTKSGVVGQYMGSWRSEGWWGRRMSFSSEERKGRK